MKKVIKILLKTFGCSTLQAPAEGGGYYFGRNFDWIKCDSLIVESHPAIVFDQQNMSAVYYHREDYTKGYIVYLDIDKKQEN